VINIYAYSWVLNGTAIVQLYKKFVADIIVYSGRWSCDGRLGPVVVSVVIGGGDGVCVATVVVFVAVVVPAAASVPARRGC